MVYSVVGKSFPMKMMSGAVFRPPKSGTNVSVFFIILFHMFNCLVTVFFISLELIILEQKWNSFNLIMGI